jgi:methylenetetrahydrofolate--tRNA-(uracil-5-)-methyltransferase
MIATVVGGGLAGCEAAWQLAKRGVQVTLVEMKPRRMTPAQSLPTMAELVCSNSLRSDRLSNAVGLLKEEMRRLDSLILRVADATRVPAGGALAVDREGFSRGVDEAIRAHQNITVECREVTDIPQGPVIIATGPLTSDALGEAIAKLDGLTTLSFYDAAAPIVTADSLDQSRVFTLSRYGRGEDYINCPMHEAEYLAFVRALQTAETVPVKGFEEKSVFEGCMPIESMAKRGDMAIAFGPLKPVGLADPRTGKTPFAVVQLRRDNFAGTLYNIVGFQTRLTFPEQRRVFRMIPGLENAEFARLGVMHRQHLFEQPRLSGRDLPRRQPPGALLCRADDGRGGLRGKRGQRADRGAVACVPADEPHAARLFRPHGHRGHGALRGGSQRALSAHELRFRADRRVCICAGRKEDPQQAGALRAHFRTRFGGDRRACATNGTKRRTVMRKLRYTHG